VTDQPSRAVRIDWTIPIWGVIGLLLQGVAVVWFLANLSGDVARSAARLDKAETRISALETQSTTIARLDERTTWIYEEMRGVARDREQASK
jgi:hypothetical protein